MKSLHDLPGQALFMVIFWSIMIIPAIINFYLDSGRKKKVIIEYGVVGYGMVLIMIILMFLSNLAREYS